MVTNRPRGSSCATISSSSSVNDPAVRTQHPRHSCPSSRLVASPTLRSCRAQPVVDRRRDGQPRNDLSFEWASEATPRSRRRGAVQPEGSFVAGRAGRWESCRPRPTRMSPTPSPLREQNDASLAGIGRRGHAAGGSGAVDTRWRAVRQRAQSASRFMYAVASSVSNSLSSATFCS